MAAALSATLAGPRLVAAQPSAAGRIGPYERALRLVESGRGAEGRSLTDSLVGAAAPGSPVLAEALWWRAALASEAGSAEKDLRRLLDEVPASPRTGPATVRLAQLALLRDRPDEAAALLEPLSRARAGDPMRPLAGYWLARARVERRDVAGACAALDGVATGPVLDPDLARQVTALRRRVPGCAGATGGAVALAPAPVLSAPGSPMPTTPAPSSPPPAPSATPGASVASTTATRAGMLTPGSAAGTPLTTGTSPALVTRPAPPTSLPAPVPGAPAGGSATAAPPVGPTFAVQVAAYDTRGGAESLATRLRATGVDAFAEGQGPAGDAAPFRVKVGRYATRAAATTSLASLRGRGLTGFVTTARPAAPALR